MKKFVCFLLVVGFVFTHIVSAYAVETIKVWGMGEEGKKLGGMVDKFELEYPNIKVEVQAIPWESAHDKLITGIAGSTVPDVAQMGTTWMTEFGSIGVFTDLSNFLKNSDLNKDDFYEGSYKTNVIDEKLFGLPWYVDTRVLYYRTDLLQEIGYNHAPQTWKEFKDVARKLTEDGGYAIDLPNNDEQVFLPIVWQNGGSILGEDGQIAVTEPEFIEAMEYYVSFFKEGLAPLEAEGTNIFQEFASGRKPMFFSGPWMINMINDQAPEIDGRWSVAVMPKKKTCTSFVGGCNLVIFNQSKHKEAAWKFIEFMSRTENQVEWYKISHDLPANKYAWEDPIFADKSMVKVFGEQLNDTRAPINVPQWEQIASFIKQRLQEANYQVKTPEEAVKALAEDIEKVLQ